MEAGHLAHRHERHRRIDHGFRSRLVRGLQRVQKVAVKDLQRWNQLRGNDLKLGQELLLQAPKNQAAVLAALADKLGMPTLAKNFIGVVALNRRAGDIPGMAQSFAEKAAKHRGASRITARVATAITKDQTLDLESAISKALGRSVTVDVEVDPALLGGLQIKMGSRLVDASIRTKLNNLTNLMKGA